MKYNLNYAKELLINNNYTCVITKDEQLYTSNLRGVAPLVNFIFNETDLEGFYAADKVIGKATAFLYAKLKVSAIYALVISKPALKVLEDYGIKVEYVLLVDNIVNRNQDGLCPFEKEVLFIDDLDSAYQLIINKFNSINK